jgi:uncharacterized FlaG/YvyC family protein
MTGNLTVAAQASAPELAPRARQTTHASIAMPARPEAQLQSGRPIAAERPRADDSDRLEATRLRALVTDPGVRVSLRQDEASGRVVVQVVSRGTGEVVDQIPAEELLRLYSALREPLLDERA